MLSFRAIVEIDAHSEGVTKPVARAKTRREIKEKMLEIAKERTKDNRLHVFIGHTRAPEEAEEFKRMIESQFKCDKIYVYGESATVAVFNGRNLLDFAFYACD
jgi:fatty acid-binding protein DegV